MTSVDTLPIVVWEDVGCTIMARILGNAGTAITQSSLSAITLKVYDPSGTLVVSPTVTIPSSVFDTLQTPTVDSRWSVDDTGYNFRYTVPATAFPDGDKKYTIDFNFDPASGDDFCLVVEASAKNRLVS